MPSWASSACAATPSAICRSFIGWVSDVDQREAREVGEKAVQFAMWGAVERWAFAKLRHKSRHLSGAVQ